MEDDDHYEDEFADLAWQIGVALFVALGISMAILVIAALIT